MCAAKRIRQRCLVPSGRRLAKSTSSSVLPPWDLRPRRRPPATLHSTLPGVTRACRRSPFRWGFPPTVCPFRSSLSAARTARLHCSASPSGANGFSLLENPRQVLAGLLEAVFDPDQVAAAGCPAGAARDELLDALGRS